jgi:protein SCO1/2
MRGKTIFLFFGFTKCPHICPLTISNLKQMVNLLPEHEKDSVRILFISVDNVRDTDESLKKLAKIYGPQFYSATASDKTLRKITSSFGAGYARFKSDSGALIVDHTSSVFVINKKGQWTMTLSNNSTGDEMLQARQQAEVRNKPPLPEPFDAEALGESKDCNLSEKSCTLKTSKGTITVDFTQRPVVTQQNIRFTASVDNHDLIPKEADLTSVEVNMGYLRPQLGPDQNKYSGQIRFPVCEQNKMNWVMRLILTDKSGKNYVAGFKFTTMDPK